MKPVTLHAEPVEASTGKHSGEAEYDAVVCISDGFGVDEVLRILPYRRILAQMSPAAAFEMCLEGRAETLVIDVTPLSVRAVSALAQLHMLRPELPIILMYADDGLGELRGTVLDGLPRFPLPRQRARFTELGF
jgi:hypothetical protein